MATRVYIVPATTAAQDGFASVRVPSYVPANSSSWQAMDFGAEPVFIVVAQVTNGQHTTIAAQSPITVVPADLSSTVGANVAATETALESWNIPGQWVTSGMTWRQVCKGIATIFQLAQRFNGLHRIRIFLGGVTLATTVSQLTQTQRDKLAAVSDSFGWDRSGVTGATTMRQLIRAAAAQWSGNVLVGGETL